MAVFCCAVSLVLSIFKMLGEISNETNSFFSEFSTKYFCRLGSLLQLNNNNETNMAK
jgi:hypothetical protein